MKVFKEYLYFWGFIACVSAIPVLIHFLLSVREAQATPGSTEVYVAKGRTPIEIYEDGHARCYIVRGYNAIAISCIPVKP